jgi:acyl-CoA dehydrogenase
MTIARREILKHDPQFRMSGGRSATPAAAADRQDDAQVFARP